MKRTSDFITMVSTGEKPDAEIHVVGFNEKDGVACQSRLHGDMRSHAYMISSLVDHYIEVAHREQGKMAVAAFVGGIATTIAKSEYVDKDVMRMLDMMANPEKLIGALGKMLGALGIDADEEDEE